MERIWAPWRMEYIAGTKDEGDKGCFLCAAAASEENSLVLTRRPKAFLVMNKYPYANGHVMVVPNRHVGKIEDLTEDELREMMSLVQLISSILREEMSTDGLNIGINMGKAAGAGLEEHIHIHVVPRWFGDTNFMPVIGETKVISEHLYETFRRLKERVSEKVL